MLYMELLGYVAGMIVAVALTPQVIKSWKTKSTKDISMPWTITLIIGLGLWIVYGFGINSYPVIITTIVEEALAVTLLILKFK